MTKSVSSKTLASNGEKGLNSSCMVMVVGCNLSKVVGTVLLLLAAMVWSIATPVFASTPAGTVRATLQIPDGKLNYEKAKLTFDRIIDADFDKAAVSTEIDRLTKSAREIAAGGSDIDKLKAVRQVIYDAGKWNESRPFSYDHADPYGKNIRNKLLVAYINTRRGNCVSMPILHLIVGERLGLNVSLSTAPLHIFLRYTNPQNGRSIAIEPTSGGYPAREQQYREKLAISDTQVRNGIYLGQLTKRESIAHMASTVMEWLIDVGRYQESVDVADVILEYFPKDVHALLKRAQAHGLILQSEFFNKYPTPASVPASLRPRYQMLEAANVEAFKKAEGWGWTPPVQIQ